MEIFKFSETAATLKFAILKLITNENESRKKNSGAFNLNIIWNESSKGKGEL